MSEIRTSLCELLGIDYPILQAGMGGPASTNDLAVAVSNAGGLGTISIGESDAGPEGAREWQDRAFEYVSARTEGPYAANIPIGSPKHSPPAIIETADAYVERALELKRAGRAEGFEAMITSAGDPTRWHDEITDAGLRHIQKVATRRQAKKAEKVGCDAIIAAGYEMGGHTHPEDKAVHTFVLLPAVSDAVDVPVVAAGGVRTGKSLLGALALGADGVSMGTRLLLTEEADFPDAYKTHIQAAGEHDDVVIEGVFSPANRSIESGGVDRLAAAAETMNREEIIELEHELWNRSMAEGDVESGLVPAGQGGCYIDDRPSVESLLQELVDSASAGLAELNAAWND